jgi:hypothetical protein
LTGPTKQAINWAIGEEVNADIISMSWTISEFEANNIKLKDRLLDTLSTAANKRIIFAATGDRGLTAPSPYPADFSSTIAIATTPMAGPGNNQSDIDRALFCLPGDDLEVIVPKYLNPQGVEKTSGSSAATALAAGLASLILTCVRFAFYEPSSDSTKHGAPSDYNDAAESAFNHFRHQDNMKHVFKVMCTKEHLKFVQPWIAFADLDSKNFDDAKQYLRNFLDSTLKNK